MSIVAEKVYQFVVSYFRPDELVCQSSEDRTFESGERYGPAFVEAYYRAVFFGADAVPPSEFHEANAALFQFVPPAERANVLQLIRGSCGPVADSVICRRWEGVPTLPPTCLQYEMGLLVSEEFDCIHDRNTFHSFSAVRDVSRIPAISEEATPGLYAKFMFVIASARKVEMVDLADRLELKVQQGKLRYLEGLDFASAFVDPRDDSMIFGSSFFRQTWADEIEWLRKDVTDDEVLAYAQKAYSFGMREERAVPDRETALRLGMKRERIIESILKERLEKKKQYEFYYGNLDPKTFPPEMPLWLITIPHEVRHTQQHAQERTSWIPDWAMGKRLDGIEYYKTLSTWMLSVTYAFPYQAMSQGMLPAVRAELASGDPGVGPWSIGTDGILDRLGTAQERDASLYGVEVARKIFPLWNPQSTR